MKGKKNILKIIQEPKTHKCTRYYQTKAVRTVVAYGLSDIKQKTTIQKTYDVFENRDLTRSRVITIVEKYGSESHHCKPYYL